MIAVHVEAVGEDHDVVVLIVAVIAGLGGYYVADIVRKRNGL